MSCASLTLINLWTQEAVCIICKEWDLTSQIKRSASNLCLLYREITAAYCEKNTKALFFLWRCGPTRAMASSFFRFIDHAQRRNKVGRSHLVEWTAHRRDLYLTTRKTRTRQSRRNSNPQYQQTSGRRIRLRPFGHWYRQRHKYSDREKIKPTKSLINFFRLIINVRLLQHVSALHSRPSSGSLQILGSY
jgi:hypothetical protein